MNKFFHPVIISMIILFPMTLHANEIIVKKTHGLSIAKRYLNFINGKGLNGKITQTKDSSNIIKISINTTDLERTISILNQNNIKYRIINNKLFLGIHDLITPKDQTQVDQLLQKLSSLSIKNVITKQTTLKKQYIVSYESNDHSDNDQNSGKYSFELNKKYIEFDQGMLTREKNQSNGLFRNWLEGQFSFNDHLRLSLGLRLSYYTESVNSNYSNTVISPNGTFLEYETNNYIFSLGFQCLVWGKLDTISPNDKICPKDLNRWPPVDVEQTRLAVPMLYTKFNIKSSELEFFVSPQYTPPTLPKKNSVWYPIDFTNGYIHGGTDSFGNLLNENSVVKKDVDHLSFGTRYSLRQNSFDASLNLIKATSPSPTFYLNPNFVHEINAGIPLPFALADYNNNLLIMEYPNETSLGYDFSIPIKQLVFRMEHNLTLNHLVTKSDYNTMEINRHEIGANLDYSFDSSNSSAILFVNYLKNQTKEKIFDSLKDLLVGINLNYTSWNDEFLITSLFIYSLEKHDQFLRNKLTYKLNDLFDLSIGHNFYDGKKTSLFGFYKNNKNIFVNLRGDF